LFSPFFTFFRLVVLCNKAESQKQMLFVVLFVCLVVGTTPIDGVWQLDQVHSVGSIDAFMELMGLDKYKRDILRTIDVTDTYRITEKEFLMTRRALFQSTDFIYVLGKTVDENDLVMGSVKHTVIYTNAKLQETLVRPDGGTFISIKKVNRDDEHKIIYSMNFTHPSGRKASCVRYFLKRG
jgi:hypothetical protein